MLQILATVARVYLMHEGQVVESGAPAEIVASPVARQVYLGERFSWSEAERAAAG